MASKASPFSRSEIQEAIRTQGEKIRQLKLEEQTDEVKNKVKFVLLFFSNQFLKVFISSRTCGSIGSGITWC